MSIGIGLGLYLGRGGNVSAPAFASPASLPGLIIDANPSAWAASSDTNVIATWPNAGTAGDLAQTTAARKPIVKKAATTGFPMDVARFAGTDDGLATAAYTHATATQKLAVWAVYRVTSGNAIIAEASADASAVGVTDAFWHFFSTTMFAYHQGDVGPEHLQQLETLAFSPSVFHYTGAFHDKSLPGNEIAPHVDNYARSNFNATTAKDNTNGFFETARVINVGARNATGTPTLSLTGDIAHLVVADTTNWGQWFGYYVQKIENYFRTNYLGLPAYTANVVFDGDSRTYGLNLTANLDYPSKVKALVTTDVGRFANVGIPSETLATMITRAPTAVDRLYAKGMPSLKQACVIFANVNDGVNAAASAATMYANLVSYCQARRAAGWQKIVVCTEIPAKSTGAISAGWDAKMTALNALIRAGWTTFADALADFSADPAFDADADADNTTYYQGDKVHQTTTGTGVLAGIVQTALASLGIT